MTGHRIGLELPVPRTYVRIVALRWEQTGRWLWQGFDVRKRLVAEVAGFDVWHEEARGGVREVVVDGRYWAVWVYEERLPEHWATAQQAREAAERTVAPRRGWLE
jgi:hypothetical protein